MADEDWWEPLIVPMTEEDRNAMESDEFADRRHFLFVEGFAGRPGRKRESRTLIKGDKDGCAEQVRLELLRLGKIIRSKEQAWNQKRLRERLLAEGRPIPVRVLTPSNPWAIEDIQQIPAGTPIPRIGDTMTTRGADRIVQYVEFQELIDIHFELEISVWVITT